MIKFKIYKFGKNINFKYKINFVTENCDVVTYDI